MTSHRTRLCEISIFGIMVLAIGIVGCQTIAEIQAENKKIRASAIKTEQQAANVSQAFAKEIERCEANGLQDCIYGVPYGPASEEGGKKLSMGICSGLPNYFDKAEHAPCRWTCANTELAHRKECIGVYGYTAILQPTSALKSFPQGRDHIDPTDLDMGLQAFWGVLESSKSWTATLDESARTLASGGNLRTLALKEKDGIDEFLVLFGSERVGFVRWQQLPQDVEGQFFLAKAEEKYGKAEHIKAGEPISKLYRWSKLGKRQRFLGVIRGLRDGSSNDLGQTDVSPLHFASTSSDLYINPARMQYLAKGYPDQLVTVMVDLARLQELVKIASSQVKTQKENADAEKSKQRQNQVDSVKY